MLAQVMSCVVKQFATKLSGMGFLIIPRAVVLELWVITSFGIANCLLGVMKFCFCFNTEKGVAETIVK